MNKFLKVAAVLATVSFVSGAAFAAEPKSATAGVAMDDMALTAKVKAALMKDERTSGFDTHVKTANGVVHLEGTVKDQMAFDAAKEVASKVQDVKEVDTTDLKVAPAA